MQFPINMKNAPFKEKYLMEERILAPWTRFGVGSTGKVDIADTQEDIVTGLTEAQAERILKARSRFLQEFIAALNTPESKATKR